MSNSNDFSGLINEFKGQYRFLSNFHVHENGLSVEHYYQAAKTLDKWERMSVLSAPNPASAKRLGRTVTLRPDWDDVKLSFMFSFVSQKFLQPDLRELLEATGNAKLVEGNNWNDTFWGVDLATGVGLNMLGKILMDVRAANRVAFYTRDGMRI